MGEQENQRENQASQVRRLPTLTSHNLDTELCLEMKYEMGNCLQNEVLSDLNDRHS